MNSNHNNKGEWTVVGQKKNVTTKNKKRVSPERETLDMDKLFDRPDDYQSDSSLYLINTIIDQVKGLSNIDTLLVMGKITNFAIENMLDVLKKVSSESHDIKDDQKKVINLNGYIEKTSDIIESMNTNMLGLNEETKQLISNKNKSITNIKKFLITCGIEEHNKTSEVKKKHNNIEQNVSISNINPTIVQNSYKDVVGANSSELVVEKTPVKMVNKIVRPKSLMVDTTIVDIYMPVASDIKNTIGYTLTYLDYCKVFVIEMNGTVFTTGPGNFVNLKNSSERTKHAKRCLNPQPCKYKNCKYYHDPCIVYDDYNTERNFALSYIVQLLSNVKNNTDLMENKSVRTPNFLRDLVQLGGIILLKAAQIKAMYFQNRPV